MIAQHHLTYRHLLQRGQPLTSKRIVRYKKRTNYLPSEIAIYRTGRLCELWALSWEQSGPRGEQHWFPVRVTQTVYFAPVGKAISEPVPLRMTSYIADSGSVRIGEAVNPVEPIYRSVVGWNIQYIDEPLNADSVLGALGSPSSGGRLNVRLFAWAVILSVGLVIFELVRRLIRSPTRSGDAR